MYESLLRLSLIFIFCFSAVACSGVKIKEANKKFRAVNLLELRTSKQEIFSKIGEPEISKIEKYEGGEVEIIYYKTWIKIDAKGKESDAAFTPLYYYNGKLIMIGDEVRIGNFDHIASFNAFKQAFPSRKEIYIVIDGD